MEFGCAELRQLRYAQLQTILKRRSFLLSP